LSFFGSSPLSFYWFYLSPSPLSFFGSGEGDK
jgi:hypothetical protein